MPQVYYHSSEVQQHQGQPIGVQQQQGQPNDMQQQHPNGHGNTHVHLQPHNPASVLQQSSQHSAASSMMWLQQGTPNGMQQQGMLCGMQQQGVGNGIQSARGMLGSQDGSGLMLMPAQQSSMPAIVYLPTPLKHDEVRPVPLNLFLFLCLCLGLNCLSRAILHGRNRHQPPVLFPWPEQCLIATSTMLFI